MRVWWGERVREGGREEGRKESVVCEGDIGRERG